MVTSFTHFRIESKNRRTKLGDGLSSRERVDPGLSCVFYPLPTVMGLPMLMGLNTVPEFLVVLGLRPVSFVCHRYRLRFLYDEERLLCVTKT